MVESGRGTGAETEATGMGSVGHVPELAVDPLAQSLHLLRLLLPLACLILSVCNYTDCCSLKVQFEYKKGVWLCLIVYIIKN